MNVTLNAFFEQAAPPGVFYVDLLAVQCGESGDDCAIFSEEDNSFHYFDNNHQTLKGATELGAKLKQAYPFLF